MQNFMLREAERPKPGRVSLSVVIPSHNPEALFFIEIGKLLAEHPDWQVIVVDDGSDRALQEFLPQTANLTVLRNATAQGAGTSRILVYRRSLEITPYFLTMMTSWTGTLSNS